MLIQSLGDQMARMAGRPPSEKTGPYPNRVRELRLAAGLTQDALAVKIRLSPGQVGKIERGETKLHSVHVGRLSEALRCRSWELFEHNNVPTQTQTDLLELLEQLSPDNQKLLLAMGHTLKSAQPAGLAPKVRRRTA